MSKIKTYVIDAYSWEDYENIDNLTGAEQYDGRLL